MNYLSSCLYIFLTLYVDDLVAAEPENWNLKFNKFMQYLLSKIEITNLGALQWYLSVSWSHNVDGKQVIATQTAYIKRVTKVWQLRVHTHP